MEPSLLVSSNSFDQRAPIIRKDEKKRVIPSRSPEVTCANFNPGAIFAVSAESPKQKPRAIKKTALQSQYLPPVQHKSPYLSSRFNVVQNRRVRLNSDETLATSYTATMTKTPAKSKTLRKAPINLTSSRKGKKAGSDFNRTMAACLLEHPIN